jgi:tetratricopeptide (TPR) repeat protein
MLRLVCTLLVALSFVRPACAIAQGTPGHVLGVEAWRSDLRTLAAELPRMHRNAFHSVTRDSFERAIAALDAEIPSLADHEVIIGLARIVAMIGDGHTRLTLPEDSSVAFERAHTPTPAPADPHLALHRLPLRLELFEDGLFVSAATPLHAALVGRRVLRIGNATAAEAIERVRPLIHYDNEMGFKYLAPSRLVIPEVLHALRITADPLRATFATEDSVGSAETVALEALPAGIAPTWESIDERSEAGLALWLRQPERAFRLVPLEGGHTLYVQLNKVGDEGDESLAEFSRRLSLALATPPVERLVLDLRRNDGGNQDLDRSLVLAIARSPRVNRPGGFYVIIGRRTFSAAMMLSSQLEYWTHATFVGEPTGSSTSNYGDSRKLLLPHSGLTVRISTRYWRDWSGDEKRPWIAPAIATTYTSRDAAGGRDPALAAILARPAHESLASLMRPLLDRGDDEAAWLVYFRYHTDPWTAGVSTEVGMNRLAQALADSGKFDAAETVYSLTCGDYPNSVEALEGLGRIYASRGATKAAITMLRRVIVIAPNHRDALALLKRLETEPARQP